MILLLSSILALIIALIIFFFFNDTATTEIYTLSLHDALPIFARHRARLPEDTVPRDVRGLPIAGYRHAAVTARDRKSTRLNSSHSQISYAVFCLKKKKKRNQTFKLHMLRTKHRGPSSCLLSDA